LHYETFDGCGCRLGSQIASIALIGYLTMSIALPLLRGASVTFSWRWALAAVLGATLVGKTLGVLRAKQRQERKSP
jgi:hypothetical protein